MICIYLILWWAMGAVQMSVQSDWQKELNLSIEKIAKMSLSSRKSFSGFMVLVMIGCGALLFAMMSSEDPNATFVNVTGLLGIVAGMACMISEVYTVTKETKKRRR